MSDRKSIDRNVFKRPPKETTKTTQLIHIDTEFANYISKDKSSCFIYLEEFYRHTHANIKIKLKSAEIPLTYYTLSPYTNIFTFKEVYISPPNSRFESINQEIVLPIKNYSENEFATELATALNNVSPYGLSYTVIYDDRNHLFKFSITSPNDINKYETVFIFDNYSPYNILGFSQKNYLYEIPNNSTINFTSELISNFIPHKNFYIKTNLTHNSIYHPKHNTFSNIIAKIPIKGSHLTKDVLTYVDDSDFYSTNYNDRINFIVISISTHDDKPIELHHHWSVTLEIIFE